MRPRLPSHLSFAIAVAATFLAGLALATGAAGSASSFRVGMLPNSYVTFQMSHHPPEHQDYGYFGRGLWRDVKDCGLHATHHGKWVHVRIGNHRITNPNPFRVWVRCRAAS